MSIYANIPGPQIRRRKRGHFYPRLAPDQVADRLVELAGVLRSMGWAEKGGFLIRDDRGEVRARTKWIPREQWWAERPFWFNEQQCAGIVDKRLRGLELTALERRAIDYLLQVSATGPEQQEEAVS